MGEDRFQGHSEHGVLRCLEQLVAMNTLYHNGGVPRKGVGQGSAECPPAVPALLAGHPAGAYPLVVRSH